MVKLTTLIKKIKKCFSPEYIYTLDYTFDRKADNGNWLFKEYGSHTYVKKNWEQILIGNFLNCVNPKDIAFIAETEAKEKLESLKINILEETRNGELLLGNDKEEMKIKIFDFLVNPELVERTSSLDVSRIAYSEGIRKGREISSLMSRKEKPIEKGKPVLKLIK